MALKHVKRCSILLIIREMQFNRCPEIPFAAIRFAEIQKNLNMTAKFVSSAVKK